jgi:hypothetical protein
MPIGFITDKEIRAKLEEYGLVRVKRMVESGEFSTSWLPNIAKWLAEKDEEEKRKKDTYDTWMLWLVFAGVVVGVGAIVMTWFH